MSFEETYNYRSFSSSSSEGKSKDFKSCLRAGDNALDFELASIEGARIRLSDFRNKKHVCWNSAVSLDRRSWVRSRH